MYNWNRSGTECDCMFYCSDDFNDPRERKTLEDLDYFIVTKFGASIVHENIPLQKDAKNIRFDEDYKINSIVDGNPIMDLMEGTAKTSYKTEYPLIVSKPQLDDINKNLRELFPKQAKDKMIKPVRNIRDNLFELRIGQW